MVARRKGGCESERDANLLGFEWRRQEARSHLAFPTLTSTPYQASTMATTTSNTAPVDVLSAKLRSLRSPSASSQPAAAVPAPSAAAATIEPVSPVPTDFVVPQKRIVTPKQLARWENSEACAQLLAWIATCNDAVVGKKLTDKVDTSEVSRLSFPPLPPEAPCMLTFSAHAARSIAPRDPRQRAKAS